MAVSKLLIWEYEMILIWRAATDPETWTEGELTNYLDLCGQGFDAAGCVPLPHPFPDSTVEIATETVPSDFFFAGVVMVVSGKLKKLLERFQVNAEYARLNIVQNGQNYVEQRFYLLNLLDVVECFDFQNSQYTMTTFGASEITKLVLDESKAVGHHLFRVGQLPSGKPNSKAVRNVIDCASEELAAHIIESGLTGVALTTADHWKTYPPPRWKAN